MKRLFFLFAFALLLTGCSDDDDYISQPPQAVIENLSAVTTIGQGESVTLKANVTSGTANTFTWAIDGDTVEGATDQTFEFTSDQVGNHVITLTVENRDGTTTTDQITITVGYLISFENVPSKYLAGPNSSGDNLYSTYGAGQYTGYDDPSGLILRINDPYETDEPDFWNGGIAISQWNDMTTTGYLNQCSVYYKDAATGYGGYNGSKTFAVATGYNDPIFMGDIRSSLTFDDNTTEAAFDHFWVTNNTYAALSMMNGDGYAKKFGSGDWFKLVINAYDKSGNSTGNTVEFYLADFRTSTSPGIITEWKKVDLTPLGSHVHTVKFDLQSSDTGSSGMNTPAYFCFDNLVFVK